MKKSLPAGKDFSPVPRFVAPVAPFLRDSAPRIPLSADKVRLQADMLENRLRKRYRHLCKWARRTGCDAFRLYDRDIPEIPLMLDVYAVGREAAAPFVSGALYKRPYDKPPAEEEAWLTVMRGAVGTALAVPEKNIFLKQREHQRGTAQYQKNGKGQVTAIVREKDMRFMVNLSDYLDTGLFLDARKVRAWVEGSSAGKQVLNLFCYTGSLSLAAMKGGAASVDSVDLSSTYLEWAEKNVTLNGCMDKRCHFIRADVLSFIKRTHGQTWDLIILDPPVFSNSKKMIGIFDVKRDHRLLIQNCLSLLTQNGVLLFGVKSKGFVLDAPPSATVTDVTERMIDEDFRTKNGGKWYVLQKKER
jgi:23S rRNA G2069 N7-methylase RlmK/C1962 C5-methylase RlmI